MALSKTLSMLFLCFLLLLNLVDAKSNLGGMTNFKFEENRDDTQNWFEAVRANEEIRRARAEEKEVVRRAVLRAKAETRRAVLEEEQAVRRAKARAAVRSNEAVRRAVLKRDYWALNEAETTAQVKKRFGKANPNRARAEIKRLMENKMAWFDNLMNIGKENFAYEEMERKMALKEAETTAQVLQAAVRLRYKIDELDGEVHDIEAVELAEIKDELNELNNKLDTLSYSD